MIIINHKNKCLLGVQVVSTWMMVIINDNSNIYQVRPFIALC